MGKLHPLGEMTLDRLGLGGQGVVSATLEQPILAAMELLRDRGISAIAVTEESGQLAGNFSAADLKVEQAGWGNIINLSVKCVVINLLCNRSSSLGISSCENVIPLL